MTVKVVSSEPLNPKRIVCSGCYYELEYTPNDVVTGHRPHRSFLNESERFQYIVCPRPECQTQVITEQAR